MPKLDVYLRSIEKFGAAGAVLTSGQAVTLRFPTGDRHATQVTPHDQLVGLVREIAPPVVFDRLDQGRPARLEIQSSGRRYGVNVTSRGGVWQIAIEAIGAVAEAVPATAHTAPTGPGPAATATAAPAAAPTSSPPPAPRTRAPTP